MCTYSITVNDTLIERARPAIGADTDIGQWMQRQMEALLIRLARAPQHETKQYAPDQEAILAMPKQNHIDVPDVVLSLLGAGEPVTDHDLNAREAYHQYLMEKYQ